MQFIASIVSPALKGLSGTRIYCFSFAGFAAFVIQIIPPQKTMLLQNKVALIYGATVIE